MKTNGTKKTQPTENNSLSEIKAKARKLGKPLSRMTVDELLENFSIEELTMLAWQTTYENHQKGKRLN